MLMVNDLLRHNQKMMRELSVAVTHVLESGWYVLGDQVKLFEREFAAYCQVEHCISVANGTDALELALRALGVKQGDKVITVANAGGYSTTAVLAVGAMPEYVDIDPDTLLLSIEHLRKLICSDIRAIIVTHLYGQAAPVDVVLNVTAEYDIPVVEDCAQAHGALLNDRKVGSFGALSCFSFYPTKNLGALGDGGAVITDDESLAAKVRQLRQYGWKERYCSTLAGGRNSRLDELQAAVLRIKLPYLERWNQRRREIARSYNTFIDHAMVRKLSVLNNGYVGHLYVILCAYRQQLQSHLRSCGIASDIHYPIPDYRQPSIKDHFVGVSLPSTERACSGVLTLPCFPEMTDFEVAEVVDAVNAWRL